MKRRGIALLFFNTGGEDIKAFQVSYFFLFFFSCDTESHECMFCIRRRFML